MPVLRFLSRALFAFDASSAPRLEKRNLALLERAIREQGVHWLIDDRDGLCASGLAPPLDLPLRSSLK